MVEQQVYDNNLNYWDCLKGIVIARRKKEKDEIAAEYPLFCAKFPEMFDIVFSRNITIKQLQASGQKQLYDNKKTYARCLYELICATHEFGAVEKRASAETMPDWVAWYEDMMRQYPLFYDNFKTLMRKICEGRLQNDPIACMFVVSIEMVHRGAISREEQAAVFDSFATRKGVFGQQIQKLRITEQEWEEGVESFFKKHPDAARPRRENKQ